jgi:hypothetical protein
MDDSKSKQADLGSTVNLTLHAMVTEGVLCDAAWTEAADSTAVRLHNAVCNLLQGLRSLNVRL